jgi:DNA polymerase-3 subunit delta
MAPLFLFVIMARQIILIDRARRAADTGLSLPQFQSAEGLRDFVAKKVWGARRLFSDDEMDALLSWAHRVDVAMKTGYGEPDVWLMAWTALWAQKKSPRSARGANV